MKVGFIGVGNMGGPMCRNIVKRSNHQVTVFDLNAAAVKTCTDLGATAARSVAEATRSRWSRSTRRQSPPRLIRARTVCRSARRSRIPTAA